MKDHVIAVRDGTKYILAFSNGARLGEAYQEVDGYYYFEPSNPARGFWQPFILRAIADKLDEINRPWNDMIEREVNAMQVLGGVDVDPTTSKFDDDERE